jgi:hypothetical protein
VFVNGGAFTMSNSAKVHSGDLVYLTNGKVITLSGHLTANPAANIECSATSGDQVLAGSITEGANYKKFWLNGVSNENGDMIDTEGKIK